MHVEQMDETIRRYGTPTYLFDTDIAAATVQAFRQALGGQADLCYAMKANPFLVQTMTAWVDRIEVCSMGEFYICQEAGIPPEKLLISGVRKDKEALWEVLDLYGGKCGYTVESLKQYAYLKEWSNRHAQKLSIYLRLSSGNQFGMDEDTVAEILEMECNSSYLQVMGIHYFSGTQKKSRKKILEELQRLDALLCDLEQRTGSEVPVLEYGPGLTVPYFEDQVDERWDTLKAMAQTMETMQWKGRVVLEMGRALVADAGYYLTRVKDTKCTDGTNYCIVDGGMHQMHYDGQICGIYRPHFRIRPQSDRGILRKWTVCGSLCTGNDILMRDVELDDLALENVFVFDRTGAYAVTEGMALFLSHELPGAVLYSQKDGWTLMRSQQQTYEWNMKRR